MATIAQRSFSGGEVTPSIYARVDTTKYGTGLRTCRNFIIMRHGGAANRSGSRFSAEVKDSSKKVRTIPFIFSIDQTYTIELSESFIRFIRDGALITNLTKTITGATQANPVVITSVGHTFSNGDEVAIDGVEGMLQLNNRNLLVANAAANTYELTTLSGTPIDSTLYGAYVSGGTASRVYQIASPYLEADLPQITFIQSADVITLAHTDHDPRELSRFSDTNWTLTAITFAPVQAAPTALIANVGVGFVSFKYSITAINTETFEESLPLTGLSLGDTPTVGSPHTISWTAAAGATDYNVYYETGFVSGSGLGGFIGVVRGTSFVNPGLEGDSTNKEPQVRNPFSGVGNRPGTVTIVQQRRIFAGSDNKPETVETSRTGYYTNYTRSPAVNDDEAITFTMAGRQVNRVKHMLDLKSLVLLTTSGEFEAQGGGDGVITPTAVNIKQHSYNGSGDLAPLLVNNNALYVQARGSIVRDLGFDFSSDGYRGNDLTIFSAHLVDGFTIVDWAFAQVPHSIVWAVRNDGVLLGLTYLKEQEMLAWHRHDVTDGFVENVCVIPESDQDIVYLVVRRTIDGETRRYHERFAVRRVDDIEDSVFMDSALTYDGRNTTATTMTLSGGPPWTYEDDLTLTASAPFFNSATAVGNAVDLNLLNAKGIIIDTVRCVITAFTSTTIVTVRPDKDVPAGFQSVALSNWEYAVNSLNGLWHLEGEDVSIFADGNVVGSPFNPDYITYTVADGAVIIPEPSAVIHVGMPYISDLETLDIDTPQGEPMVDKFKLIGGVTLTLEESRGGFVGPKPPSDDDVDPLEFLDEIRLREDEALGDPVELKTGTVELIIRPEWNSNGRIFIRQIDPLPLSVLAIAPSGKIPGGQ